MTQTIIRMPLGGPVTVSDDFVATPESLRAEVGGYFELVRIRPDALLELCRLLGLDPHKLRTGLPDPDGTRSVVMLVHETGMLDGLPHNPAASALYGGPFWFLRQAVICGDAVVLELD